MPRHIAGIACDMEGTAFSVENCHMEGFAAAANSYGIEVTAEEIINLPGTIGGGDPRVIALLLQHFDRMDIDPEEYRQRKMEHYNRLVTQRPLHLRPGFEDFCQQVRERGLPMAIASLTPKVQAMPLIERTGLNRLVPMDKVVLREDVINVKPAPDVFFKAASLIDVDPQNLLVIGDSPKDMVAAKAAGALPIATPTYWRVKPITELMEAGAEHIFRDWRTINLEGLLRTLEN